MSAVNDVDMFGSDSESGAAALPPQNVAPDQEMDDLFGDDDNEARKDDASRATSPTPSVLGESGLSIAERRARQALEYEEEEDAPPAVVREAEVPVPNIPLPQSSDGNHWIVRMPNFVKFESQPFHPDTYRGPEADLDFAEQAESLRERSMSIKLEVENTIRWKWVTGPDGKRYRQSNSRIIKWSDGSMSLQLGKELFDVTANIDTSATAPRAGASVAPATPGLNSQSQAQSQSQSAPSTPAAKASQNNASSQSLSATDDINFSKSNIRHQGLSYLVAQHHTSAILQVEAPITGFLSIRPTGMHSETHRKLVRAVGQKHSKVARLKLAAEGVVSQDPSLLGTDGTKGGKRKPRSSVGGSGSAGASTRRSGQYDDDEESDGGYDKASRRRQRSSFSRGRSSKHVYSDDDDDEDEGTARANAWDDYDDDDGGAGSSPKKQRLGGTSKAKAKAPVGTTGDYEADDFLVEDEPSDVDEDEGGSGRRRHQDEDADDEPDLLDKLDRDIEDQTRRRRKETTAGGDADVDVESEGMDVSDSGDDAVKKSSKVAASTVLAGDDEDGIPQVSRKLGKKRIIIEDDEEE